MAENPFSARHLRPGAIRYVFVDGESVESLVRRLDAHAGWGEIVGGHGTGKSTLLLELLAALAERGTPYRCITLGAGRHAEGLPTVRILPRGGILAVDGFEQLSPWRRWSWKWACRRRGWGLLVTAHRSQGLPLLFRTTVHAAVAREVVGRLSREAASRLSDAQLGALLSRHGQNLREALFDLYDAWDMEHRGEGEARPAPR